MPDLRTQLATNEARAEVFALSERPGGIPAGDIAADVELRTHMRALALRSLYFFAKAILGYKDLTKPTHRPVCDFVQNAAQRRKLLLLPRGVFKSTIGAIAYPIWRLLHDPNRLVLLANQVAGNAQRFLSEIEQHLDGTNTKMAWLFPEYIKTDDGLKPWNAQEMRLPCRDIISGTPSITTIGVGSRAESQHYTDIINDDLIGEKARDSVVEMMDTILWHDYSVSLSVDPTAINELVIGTRWTMEDLYQVLLDSGRFDVFTRPAIDPDTGEAYFPERLPLEVLAQIRDTNFSHFMSQYMNDPTNPEVLEFKKSWLLRFELVGIDEPPLPGVATSCPIPHVCIGAGTATEELVDVGKMDVGIFLDPAGSGDVDETMERQSRAGRARLSDNAIVVMGLDGEGRFFLLDSWAGRGKGGTPEVQIITKMIEMCEEWDGYYRSSYIEAYGAQSALITLFKLECKRRGLTHYTRIKEIPRGIKKAKPVRIRTGVGAQAEKGKLYVRESSANFILQFQNFGSSRKLDLLDAASWATILLRKPRSGRETLKLTEANKRRQYRRNASIGITGY